jgi:hypothetical protein
MTRYLLTNADHTTWRGNQIDTGRSVFSSNSENNVIATNADELGDSPLVAIMLNPWHAQIDQQKMLEIEISQIDVVKNDPHINLLVRESELPSVTTDQKIVFGLMVIQEVYQKSVFNEWADGWISGSDRSAESAGRMFAHLGQVARNTSGVEDALQEMGVRQDELEKLETDDQDFCARASEAIFAAQMYMDRCENWPLLVARSVSRAVTGLQRRVDLAAIAERAIASSAKGVMRTRTAA